MNEMFLLNGNLFIKKYICLLKRIKVNGGRLLVSQRELVGLLFITASELILDAAHKVIIHGVLNGLLYDIQPPGRANVHLGQSTQLSIIKLNTKKTSTKTLR